MAKQNVLLAGDRLPGSPDVLLAGDGLPGSPDVLLAGDRLPGSPDVLPLGEVYAGESAGGAGHPRIDLVVWQHHREHLPEPASFLVRFFRNVARQIKRL